MIQKERFSLRPERVSSRAALGTKTRQQYVASRASALFRSGSRAIWM
jgi:hypothetical protein